MSVWEGQCYSICYFMTLTLLALARGPGLLWSTKFFAESGETPLMGGWVTPVSLVRTIIAILIKTRGIPIPNAIPNCLAKSTPSHLPSESI